MRHFSSDSTYYGFFRVFDKEGKQIFEKIGQHCSQQVYSCDGGTTIKFYYPNDWLSGFAKSKPFLEWFCAMASEMFDNIKYIGKFESSEIGFDLEGINTSFGYAYEFKPGGSSKKIISQQSYIKNKGDLIINDLWRGFEIKVSGRMKSLAYLAYASYCLIRYLFASHYQEVVHSFVYLVRNKQAFNLKDWSDFELLQISHYFGNYGFTSGDRGFFNSQDFKCIDDSAFIYKLRTLKEFVKELEKNAGNLGIAFNHSFGNINSKVTVKQIRDSFNKKELYKIYESLK